MTNIQIYQIILLFVVLVISIFGMLRMFKKQVPMYFILYICGVWCFTIGITYISLIQLCKEVYNEVNSLGFLGTGGMFAFFATANFGEFNNLIEKPEKIHLIRVLSFIPALLVTAVIVMQTVYMHVTVFNIFTLALAMFPIPFCVYFSIKFLLMKSNGDERLTAIKPLNFCTLLICIGILFYNHFYITNNDNGMYITFGIYSVCILAEVFLADWGRKKWQS